jgi:hypothetical protein
MEKIFSDKEVFEQIKDKSRKAYIKSWHDFKAFNSTNDFDASHPGEEDIIAYFKHLRQEKKIATSSLWTTYSYINSILKQVWLEAAVSTQGHHAHQRL